MSDPTAASSPNPYAPPRAQVDDVAPDGERELAGRGTRLAAIIVDVIVLLAVNIPIAWALGWISLDAEPTAAEHVRNTLLGIVLFLVVNGVLLARHGQTVGKRLLGIRIVRSDGSRVDALRMFGIRYGVGWLLELIPAQAILLTYALVDALLIFRDSRKCLHDTLADTIVVRA